MRRLGLIFASVAMGIAGGLSGAAPAGAAANTIVTGTGDGAAAHVRVFDATGAPTRDLAAFGAGVTTGARVATGDVNGDGVRELIAATGPGRGSFVSVYEQSNLPAGGFSPYGEFPGGVFVAAGDVDGDGRDEIVTGAGAGGGPHVRVFDADLPNNITEKTGFFAYGAGFRGGVSVAVADVTGSGRADVVTGAGAGGGPHVRIFDLTSGTAVDAGGFFAYSPGFTGGVRVAAGRLSGGARIVTGPGPGGGPHVRSFSATGAEQTGFMAFAPGFTGGVNVAVGDADSDGTAEIVAAPASRGGPHVRTFEASGTSTGPEFFAYAPSMTNGVFVASFASAGSSSTQNGGSGSNSGGG